MHVRCKKCKKIYEVPDTRAKFIGGRPVEGYWRYRDGQNVFIEAGSSKEFPSLHKCKK